MVNSIRIVHQNLNEKNQRYLDFIADLKDDKFLIVKIFGGACYFFPWAYVNGLVYVPHHPANQ